MKHIIGIVAPFSGPNAAVGTGIASSVERYLSWDNSAVISHPADIELCLRDDRSTPSLTHGAVDSCLAAGAVAIIGPADSSCAMEVVVPGRYQDVPFVFSFATRSNLISADLKNTFRVTTPDVRRVAVLLRYIRQTQRCDDVTVFHLDDHPQSYSAGLVAEVQMLVPQLNMQAKYVGFSMERLELPADLGRYPILICAPSHEAVWLIDQIRRNRIYRPVFAFGSNKNFLRHKAVGTTTVCDIDYNDYNPIIQEYLTAILGPKESRDEVSLSSLLAIHVLAQAVTLLPSTDIETQRRLLIDILTNEEFQGPFGTVTFSKNGEMVGHEQISLVTVHRRGPMVYFGPPRRRELWGLASRQRITTFVWDAVITLSTIGGTLGILQLVLKAMGIAWP